MRSGVKFAVFVSLLVVAPAALAQSSPITAITLGPDQIGQVKTAQGISTRISFPEKVKEVICGDLYDANSGKGGFVIQQSDNDVYIKPIVPKGLSNMFVKVGEGDHVFNFDLEIVPVAQANRVVNVILSSKSGMATHPSGGEDSANSGNLEQRKAEIERLAHQEANEILRNARQQADRMLTQAEAAALEVERQAALRRQQETERRFMQAMMLGIRETRIKNPRAAADKVVIMLDSRILSFDEKSFLRYTIQNGGIADFTFNSIALESGLGEMVQSIPIELIQSKVENRLGTGESLTGVVVYDPKLVGEKDRLVLYVRGADNAEIMRVIVQ